MISLRNDCLPAGHAARPAVRSALLASVLDAVVFTVFAYVTTQGTPVRQGSPWQDDPYDAVVTFTMFFVPAIAALIVMRMLLCRRNEPLPMYRVAQLLRASAVSSLLATATYLTDWAAVIARADRELWDSGTPWLMAVLGLMSLLAAADWLTQARARRLLPRLGDYRGHGDWLDDARPVADLVAARLPRLAGGLAAWLDRRDPTGWIRKHFTLVIASGSLFAGLAVATALARENGVSLLFVSETIWFAGGAYAFATVCDALLQLRARQTRGRIRRAVHIAATAGALALPISMALRASILAAPGLSGIAYTPGSLTVLTLASALLTGAVAFVGTVVWPYRNEPGVTRSINRL